MRLRGLLFPSKGPHVFLWASRLTQPFTPLANFTRVKLLRKNLSPRNRSHRFYTPQYGNHGLPQHVLDFRFL